MIPPVVVGLSGIVFACAAAIGLVLARATCGKLVPFADGPRPGKPPVGALIAGAAVFGCGVAWRGADVPTAATLAFVTIALGACWYSDVACGLVPDAFTLVPLATIVSVSLALHNVVPAISAAVLLVPFGLAAWLSRGRGMGWGDVKLAALGAAVLGLHTSLVAFAAASLAAAVIAAARGRRKQPIAFAPYLVAATAAFSVFPLSPIVGR